MTLSRGRILVISQVPPPVHGSTIMTTKLLDVLRESEYSPKLVDRRFSRNVGEIGRFGARKVISAVALIVRLFRASRSKPDACIFFVTNRPFSFLVDVAISAVLKWSGVPTVAYVHTIGFATLASRNALWSRLVARLLTQPELVVTLGPSLAHDIEPWVSADKMRCIANAVEQPTPLARSERPKSLLFFSNLLAEKGPLEFIELARALCVEHPDMTATVAGAEPDPALAAELRASVVKAGLAERIRFVGPVAPEERWSYLTSASVLVFPSSYPYEAQPLTIIEAASVGLPVIAYDVGGVRDLIDDNVNGRLISLGDRSALEDAVRDAFKDDTLQRWSAGARRRFNEHHTIATYANSWREVLMELRKGTGHAGSVSRP